MSPIDDDRVLVAIGIISALLTVVAIAVLFLT